MRASRVVVSLAAIALAAPVSRAQAYCLNTVSGYQGYSVWKTEVSYYVSDTLTDPALKAAVDAAFKAWQDVSCATITFKNAGTFAIPDVPFQSHGKNGIYVFYYTSATGYPTDPKYTAYSFYGIDGAGAITQASIAVNAFSAVKWSAAPTATELDLQGELTALIGQVIGLTKSNVADSIMTGAMATGDTSKRTPKQDDIDAVSYLYPAAGCTPPAPGANGCTGGAPPAGDGSVTPPPGDGSVNPPAGDGSVNPPAGDGSVTPPKGDGGSSSYDFGTTPPGGCTNDDQCGTGQYCAANGTCMQKKEDSGCCAVAASQPPFTAVILGLGLAALLVLGRKRRR